MNISKEKELLKTMDKIIFPRSSSVKSSASLTNRSAALSLISREISVRSLFTTGIISVMIAAYPSCPL
jgi:hypothetical protein